MHRISTTVSSTLSALGLIAAIALLGACGGTRDADISPWTVTHGSHSAPLPGQPDPAPPPLNDPQPASEPDPEPQPEPEPQPQPEPEPEDTQPEGEAPEQPEPSLPDLTEADGFAPAPGTIGCAEECIVSARVEPNVASTAILVDVGVSVPAQINAWVLDSAPVLIDGEPLAAAGDLMAASDGPVGELSASLGGLAIGDDHWLIVEAIDERGGIDLESTKLPPLTGVDGIAVPAPQTMTVTVWEIAVQAAGDPDQIGELTFKWGYDHVYPDYTFGEWSNGSSIQLGGSLEFVDDGGVIPRFIVAGWEQDLHEAVGACPDEAWAMPADPGRAEECGLVWTVARAPSMTIAELADWAEPCAGLLPDEAPTDHLCFSLHSIDMGVDYPTFSALVSIGPA